MHVPEGPEIRLAADAVASVLVGKEVAAAEFGLPRLQRFERRLVGQVVTAVDTRGKAMLTRFANGLTLYTHNQLYGRWYTVGRPTIPDTGRSLRVALHTDTHSALLYSASDIEVLTEKAVSEHPFLSRLGPDILDPELTESALLDRLDAERFRGRALGGLYLDQSFLAGNGNYLRSEILWAAQLNPATRPRGLGRVERHRLARETIRIARRSYRTRGVTVAPRVAKEARARGEPYERYRFNVYGREGRPCRRCGERIERRKMASRGLFVCPGCQPG